MGNKERLCQNGFWPFSFQTPPSLRSDRSMSVVNHGGLVSGLFSMAHIAYIEKGFFP